ncbi:MAG: peptidase M28, partial [Lewinella sp.]|nr:peptidase M28 [Lewinella sp.]
MKYSLLACFLLFSYVLIAQVPRQTDPTILSIDLASTIQAADLYRHLSYLASDEMEGRETGEPGLKLAADYLVSTLENMGFAPLPNTSSFRQTILFQRQKWANISLTQGGTPLKHLQDYYSLPAENSPRIAQNIDELIFLGYGIDEPSSGHSDYAGFSSGELQGKTILIFGGIPRSGKLATTLAQTATRDWGSGETAKLEAAYRRGVANVLIIDPNFRDHLGQARRQLLDG